MDGRKPYDIAYLAARTISSIMALGVSTAVALDALEVAVQLLRDTKSDVPAQHRHEGTQRLH